MRRAPVRSNSRGGACDRYTLVAMDDPWLAGKRAAGRAAADLVQSGTTLGLGTGSTFVHALDRLGERVRDGLRVRGVATSEATAARARELGITLCDLGDVEQL